MEYQTVFDISQSGYRTWLFPVIGVVIALGGGAFYFVQRRARSRSATTGATIGLLGVVWATLTFAFTYYEYSRLASARPSVVEGPVHGFVPMPSSGHQNERFCVQSSCFSYSDFEMSSGFNNAASRGGPIREGLPVRVAYVGEKIVKLEVGKL